MHVKDVAAGKDARQPGHAAVVNVGTLRDDVYRDIGFACKFVFRYEPDGKQKRVAGDIALRSLDRPALFVYLRDRDALKTTLGAADIDDCRRKEKRDMIVFKALLDVSLQPARIWEHLENSLDLDALQRQAMMSPMSPEPRMTTRFPGMIFSRFTRFCTVPAV